MRVELPTRTDRCAMCKTEASDASGQWYIIKELRLFFPLGWLPWPALQDVGMWSLTRSHIICFRHGAIDTNTIHTIDGD